MNKRIAQLLSVHRYPEYMVDLVICQAALACLGWMHDFQIGSAAGIRGLPIISLARGSSVHVGHRAYLISRSRNTALGVNHAMVIRAMRASARICIGDDFHASGVTLCAASAIEIGDRVVMGANACVVDTDFHSLNSRIRSSGSADEENAAAEMVRIGHDVFVGMNAMILKGVSVGNGAVIGAGSVVTKDVPEKAIVAGNPARILNGVGNRIKG